MALLVQPGFALYQVRELPRLNPIPAALFEQTGEVVALKRDLAVLGAPEPILASSVVNSGHVYRSTAQGWVHEAKLSPSDGAVGDHFGSAVATANGRVFCGSPNHTGSGGADSVAVFVFEQQASNWVQVAKLEANNSVAERWFGSDLDAEGETLLIAGCRLWGIIPDDSKA
ncbi:MAG: hypothetical protein ACI841_004927 [Planctomycetota bacterium]